ncbi:Hypothetical protein HDN1F_13810 [gamma proteobacterium HdN1]|nr:Hypothetical protein HDN1F_13810 [gamma proteobacterium HdN1]
MMPFARLIPLCLLLAIGNSYANDNAATSKTANTPPKAESVSSLPPCHNILGWVEFVTLLPADHKHGVIAKAKLDTGAKTSSLQADDIEIFTRGGKKWVRFTYHRRRARAEFGMPGIPHQKHVFEAPLKRMVRIKQHTVDFVERPAIDMEIHIGGNTFLTEFTLTDRSAFNYPVLLGRRFLEATHTAVDASHMHISGYPAADQPSSDSLTSKSEARKAK